MTYPPVVARPLLLLDYDGTLAEIVADPGAAYPHPRAPELLSRLGARFPVRLLTGRRVADLGRLLDAPGVVVLGVHGMEQGALGGPVESRLDAEAADAMEVARSTLPSIDGVRTEDKGAAIALHYRGAGDSEERILRQLRAWSEGLPGGLETVWGKMVVEVRPSGYGKGRAAIEAAAEHPECTPVMIGDDTTDEDAFRALSEGVTIKVGDGDTAASYRLPDIDAVIDYLGVYLG